MASDVKGTIIHKYPIPMLTSDEHPKHMVFRDFDIKCPVDSNWVRYVTDSHSEITKKFVAFIKDNHIEHFQYLESRGWVFGDLTVVWWKDNDPRLEAVVRISVDIWITFKPNMYKKSISRAFVDIIGAYIQQLKRMAYYNHKEIIEENKNGR